MTLLAFPIGFFYVLAGIVVLRAIRLGSLMESTIQAINLSKPDPKEQIKAIVLTLGAYLTTASGAALVTLSSIATILFVLNVLVQGGYLIWATKALPPEDEDDRKGRQQTTNAFVIYSAVTTFIIWLQYTGGLRPWPISPQDILVELAAPGAAALACWALVYFPASRSKPDGAGSSGEADTVASTSSDVIPPPENLRLRPELFCWPLWDGDTGANVSHYHLDISIDLAERIENWDDRFQQTWNEEDPKASAFATEEEERAYLEDGKEIARDLAGSWPGRIEIDERFR